MKTLPPDNPADCAGLLVYACFPSVHPSLFAASSTAGFLSVNRQLPSFYLGKYPLAVGHQIKGLDNLGKNKDKSCSLGEPGSLLFAAPQMGQHECIAKEHLIMERF
jgi:hypothetical protein